jgi:hypothetical protein
MKPPAAGRLVLFFAIVAHGKSGHGRVGPVVRKRFDYGKTWPAVRAVDKRMAIPPVIRVNHFPQTSIAYGSIAGDVDFNNFAL